MQQLTPHQAEALNTQHSISLTANAGSGKTFVLAKRFIEIIVNTETKISEIAAITFTDKAAGELYKRIADELDEINKHKKSDNGKKGTERLRKQLVSANISTIHSFCIDLLKQYPVEASLDANFIPVDQRTADELIELSIEEVIKQNLHPDCNNTSVKLLLRLIGSKSALSKELLDVVQARKNLLLVKDKIYNQPENLVTEKLKTIFETKLSEILDPELPALLQNLLIINNTVFNSRKENEISIQAKKLLEQISELSTTGKLKTLSELKDLILTSDDLIKSRGYLSGNIRTQLSKQVAAVERFFADFKDILKFNGKDEITAELVKFSNAFINLGCGIINVYENKKKQKGYLDFEDILIKTRELINNEKVRKDIAQKFKYILVDEYQDTNEIQYEILMPLVDYLRSGNLFVIGDEKQSIYRFRDAELEVFDRTRDDIKNAGSSNLILTLPESFRMAPAICLFTNILFRNLFEKPRKLFNEVEHSDLICARSDSFPGQVEILYTEDENSGSEAELLAKSVLKLKQEHSTRIKEWSDIAVLVRKRAAFNEIEKAFTQYNIPFSVVGGTGFFQKQSISDVYNYLSFLFAESEDAALIGTLRSPFFSVSDLKILFLSSMPGDSYWQKLGSAAVTDNFWQQIYSTLSENLRLAKQVNIQILLRKILDESDFVSVISSRKNGLQEINNLNKLISITSDFFNQGSSSFYDYLCFLKNSISRFTDEAQAQLSRDRNSVILMTIHQAKGLEFPAVFLYRCNDRTQANRVRSRSFRIDKNFGIITKVPVGEDYFGQYYSAPVVDLYNFIESRKETAELKRLFYVAVTRAKEFIFLSLSKSAEKQNRLNSFTGLLKEALNPDLDSDSFSLSAILKFLVFRGNAFEQVTRETAIQIPVTRKIDISIESGLASAGEKAEKEFSLNFIKDHSRGELISATKYSVFCECPRKYYLTYVIGLKALIDDQGLKNTFRVKTGNYWFNTREQIKIFYEESNTETEARADIKGGMFHQILQMYRTGDEVEDIFAGLSEKSFHLNGEITPDSGKLKSELIAELKQFIDSKEYSFLNSFEKFKNEFEVYVQDGDFYLFGIIDKIIFDGNKIIIADYKTEIIHEEAIKNRAEYYLPQLFFYCYIIKRLYSKVRQIEVRIIFTKHPEKTFSKIYTESDEKTVKEGIRQMISSIRSNYYSVNLNHCSECIFTLNKNECVLDANVIHN
jgi:ATP-dependent helicase/nuclease subunit A